MTDQRNRVTTDPGLGPIEREHASTLRSMRAAEPIPDEEIPGTSVYFEPKPLHAVSDHKTLELETVKLAQDIDPRKLPTELKLRRPVLHVLPASDPNWPAPLSPTGVQQHDSNWPPPETTLTTSQFPVVARRRSFVPLVLLVLFVASLLLVLGARARRRSGLAVSVAPAAPPVAAAVVPSIARVEPLPSASSPSTTNAPASEATAATATAATAPADSAEVPAQVASAPTLEPAEPAPGATPARIVEAPHHAPSKPLPTANANLNANADAGSPALNAPSTAKPKRAIY